MTVSEKDMKPRNYEAHLVELEKDITEKTQSLTDILKKRESVQKEMDDFADEKKSFYVLRDKLEKEEGNRRQKEAIEREELASNTRTTQTKLSGLQSDIRLAERNLARINFSCLTGNKELDDKKEKISKSNDELTKLVDLVANYENLKVIHSQRCIEVNKVSLQLTQLQTDSATEIKTRTDRLNEVLDEIKELEIKRDRIAFDYKDYTDKLYTAMNDWQIIKERLETKWNQTFPELILPLNM